MHDNRNGCTLSLTADQMDMLRIAQLRETVSSLNMAAEVLEEVADNYSGGEVGDVPEYIRRCREDFELLEQLGYVRRGEAGR